MEGKKSITISVTSLFLIIAIIVIIIMGYFIYKIYNEKEIANSKIEDLDSQVSELNETLNTVKDVVNTSKNTSNSSNNTQSNSKNQIADSELNEIAKNLFIKGSEKIRETEYTDYYEYDVAKPLVEKNINGQRYSKRDVLYSDVEKDYSKIFTGDALSKVMSKRFRNIDGYLFVSDGGATGWDITNIKPTKLSENGNKVNFKVEYNNIDIDDEINKEIKKCNLTLELVDDEYRISDTDYCNL